MDVPDDIEEVNLVRTNEDAINWLVEMTGCSVGHAQIALTQSGGDISDALDVLPSIQNVGFRLLGVLFLFSPRAELDSSIIPSSALIQKQLTV